VALGWAARDVRTLLAFAPALAPLLADPAPGGVAFSVHLHCTAPPGGDGVAPPHVAAFTVLVTSPKRDLWKLFDQLDRSRRLFFPVFSKKYVNRDSFLVGLLVSFERRIYLLALRITIGLYNVFIYAPIMEGDGRFR
jgi:hypothetical protein